MRKIIMHIQYIGKKFNGWEGSDNSIVIYLQQAIEQTLGNRHSIIITCGGRTDTGVHGLGQVIDFDCRTERSCRSLKLGTNYFLKQNGHSNSIYISECYDGSKDFSSRFSATSRVYRYYLIDKPMVLMKNFILTVANIDWNIVREGCKLMVGYYDISCFCPNAYTGRRLRTVSSVELKHEIIFGHKVHFIEISSPGFAHHQVRFMTGALIMLGQKRLSIEELKQSMQQKQKLYLAPSKGLTLHAIRYSNYY